MVVSLSMDLGVAIENRPMLQVINVDSRFAHANWGDSKNKSSIKCSFFYSHANFFFNLFNLFTTFLLG